MYRCPSCSSSSSVVQYQDEGEEQTVVGWYPDDSESFNPSSPAIELRCSRLLGGCGLVFYIAV